MRGLIDMKVTIDVEEIPIASKYNPNLEENGVCVVIEGDTLTLYSDDWCSTYRVVLKGRKPRLKLVSRDERCHR